MATAVAALAAVAVAGDDPASASTVSGRITGAPIPAAGTGQAFVRAVNLQTGEVVAADDTDAAGRYRLTLPKGAFALFPSVITLSRVFSPRPTTVRLRRGQRKSVRLPARQNATVIRPIVTFRDGAFTGATGELSVLNKGLFQMLVTDLLEVKIAGCDIQLVARDAFAFDKIRAELALSRSGLVDPATAIRPGLLIEPTRGIRGKFTVSGGRMRIDAEVYKWKGGKTLRRTSVEGATEEFFELERDLTRRLAALLCNQPPPISGTFTGSIDYAQQIPVGVLSGKLDWNGSLELEPSTSPGGIPPQFGGPTTIYQVTSGTLTARIQVTTGFNECTVSGQGTFDIAAMTGTRQPVMSITEGDPDTYQLGLGAGIEQVPATLTACPPDRASSNGKSAPWPLLGILLMPSSKPPFPITTEGVFAGSATGSTPGLDNGYQWTWSLRG